MTVTYTVMPFQSAGITSLHNFFWYLSKLRHFNVYFRGTNFSIVEDTQLLLTERKDGIYAYVSYLWCLMIQLLMATDLVVS